ncbi:MAG TPA: terminase small subunit [Hymenobacter sp.]|jgi:phage terminase small subunit
MAKGSQSPKPKALSAKAKAFVYEYCKDWNATAAAERADYSPKSARQTGSDLLADERVQELIEKHMNRYGMSAGEAIAKMASWGRGTVARFLKVDEDGNMSINLHHEEAQQHLHLIKKLKQTRSTIMMGEIKRVEVKTEIELYDAKDAVHKILQLHGRYAPQKFDHTTNGENMPAGSNIYVPDNGR